MLDRAGIGDAEIIGCRSSPCSLIADRIVQGQHIENGFEPDATDAESFRNAEILRDEDCTE